MLEVYRSLAATLMMGKTNRAVHNVGDVFGYFEGDLRWQFMATWRPDVAPPANTLEA